MLKRLEVSNYMVWNDLSLPLGRVTGLFGDNGSGKSAILQFLLTRPPAECVHYLGPLREPPQREHFWSGTSPDDTGVRGELAIDAMLSATKKRETRNLAPGTQHMPFQDVVAHWLAELGLATQLSVTEIASERDLYRVTVKKDDASPEVALPDAGLGVARALPALVTLYYVPRGSLLLLEQPEMGLHPSAHGGLADAILSAASTRDLQVIVESHSEHLLRRIQRRVAEEGVSHDDVKLYATSVVKGEGVVSDLELTPLGEIKNWRKNFFGDELGELTAIRKATLSRQLQAEGQ